MENLFTYLIGENDCKRRFQFTSPSFTICSASSEITETFCLTFDLRCKAEIVFAKLHYTKSHCSISPPTRRIFHVSLDLLSSFLITPLCCLIASVYIKTWCSISASLPPTQLHYAYMHVREFIAFSTSSGNCCLLSKSKPSSKGKRYRRES